MPHPSLPRVQFSINHPFGRPGKTPGYGFGFTTALIWACYSGSALAANSIPVINSIPPLSVTEGGVSTYKVTATDADGDLVTLIASGLKTWMSFSSGTFTAKPGFTNAGTYTVKFTAKDGKSQSSSSTTITVSNVNRAPAFSGLTNKSMSEGGTLTTKIVAKDPDGELVAISASGLKSWMTFDGLTLTLKPGYTDGGTHSITFSASDGKLTTSAPLTITVASINQAPVLSALPTLSVAEGATLSHTVIVSDIDGDPVTLSATGLKPWMSFSGKTFTANPGYEDLGTYLVTLTASDGLKSSKGTLTLSVTSSNQAPVINTVGNWGVGEDKVLSRPIIATDADGDAVTVTATGLQPWMSFDGHIFQARPSAGNSGVYSVSFVASDNKNTDTETIKVTVSANGANFPPAWNQYVGSVGNSATWSGWARRPLYGTTGMGLVQDPGKITDLVEQVTTTLQTQDVMLPAVGMTGGSESAFLDLIQDGGVEIYQQAVRDQVETLAPLDPSGKRIVYQLGNEIATTLMSEGLRQWAAGRGITIPGAAMDYDPEFISYYVEYQLAPTVEAMLEASAAAYGDPNKVTIVLGSVNNGGTPEARAWLDALLDYTVQGTFAPSLAGKHVYDLIDIASVHYVGGTGKFEPSWDKWNGVGTVSGLWTTEEVGIRAADEGRGAGLAIDKVMDYLNWYYVQGLNQEQVGVSLYGWDVNGPVAGTSSDTSMLALYDFLGAVPVEPRTDVVTAEVSTGAVETYQLQSLSDDSKRVIAVTLSGADAATVSGLLFDAQGWTGMVDATLHVFSPDGHTVTPVTVAAEGSSNRIVLPQPTQFLSNGYAMLITLQRR